MGRRGVTERWRRQQFVISMSQLMVMIQRLRFSTEGGPLLQRRRNTTISGPVLPLANDRQGHPRAGLTWGPMIPKAREKVEVAQRIHKVCNPAEVAEKSNLKAGARSVRWMVADTEIAPSRPGGSRKIRATAPSPMRQQGTCRSTMPFVRGGF